MNSRTALIAAALACALAAAAGCGRSKPAGNTAGQAAATPTPIKAGPLPDNGFKAQLTLPDPPTKLRSGQKETIQVRVKNSSDVMWWALGGEVNEGQGNKYYLATGNRWLKPDGKLVTDMDGRHGILKNLKPGEESDVPLVITAPKEPGDYLLEIDLIQEQVAWFSDKGSPTTRTKVTVVK